MPEIELQGGMAGAPAAGVTAGQLAALMPKAGGTFTGETKITPAVNGSLVLIEKADGTDLLTIDTTNGILKFLNGLDIQMYSDNGVTLKASIDAATGNVDVAGTVDLETSLKGDELWMNLPTIDGGGSAIGTGLKYDFVIPYNLTVLQWRLLCDTAGTISIELCRDTYANYPPTTPTDVITGVTGTNNPRITSSANKNESSTLTSWSTSWTGGDTIRCNVVSAATITRCALSLKVRRT